MRGYSGWGLMAVLLLALVLPAAAVPAVLDSGVSTYDAATRQLGAAKDTYLSTETGEAGSIAVWVQIPQGSDVQWNKPGCIESTATNGCSGSMRYLQTSRVITPDGKEWWKDIVGLKETFKVGSSRLVLDAPTYFRGATASSEIHEYGGPQLSVSQFLPKNYPGKTYQLAGTWTVEVYAYDQDPSYSSYAERPSTLLKTLTFTIVDASAQPVTQTTAPYYLTTTPTTAVPAKPASSGVKGYIDALDYTTADVQKPGTSWDSTEEKCPTWRGNDWSGTGDYYLSRGGDSLTYSFSVPASGTYALWLRDWSDTNHVSGAREVTITIDGKPVGTFDAAASFNKGTTGYNWDKLANVDLSAGSHTLKITKKDTTSSAAIIDTFLFTDDLTEVPQGPIDHSRALCAGATTGTTGQGVSVTTTKGAGIEVAAVLITLGLVVVAFRRKRL